MFGINKKENEKKISGMLGTYKMRFDDDYLFFSARGIGGFQVLKKDIENVSIATSASGMAVLTVNGRGTVLGQAKMANGFAKEAQEFIMEEIKNNEKSTSQASSNNLDDLEKLTSLKDKGIITQKEFDAKKKQLLNI